MTLVLASFFAGILTIAAPCILPLLPVIIGGSLSADPNTARSRPYLIALSLGLSVIVFTLLLKATTALLGVPVAFWQIASGLIIILYGLQLLVPALWEQLNLRLGLQSVTGNWLSGASAGSGWKRDVTLGAALGPVFNSCSPTYALLVASVLPVSFGHGLVALCAYAIGLSGTLLLIGLIGQKIVSPLKVMSDPSGWFRKGLGVLLIVTGLFIIFGLDKMLQAYVLEQGWYDAVEGLERLFIKRM